MTGGLFFFAITGAFAHGTDAAVVQRHSVCALMSYDDGEPMSYAKVTIKAPQEEFIFQSGATDRNGIICFAPHRDGAWEVTAGDGMGHQQRLAVPVKILSNAGASPTAAQTAPTGKDRTGRVMAGIGIIFGLAGIVAMWRSTRSLRDRGSNPS